MNIFKQKSLELFDWFKPKQAYQDLHKHLSGFDSAWHLAVLYLVYSTISVMMYGFLQIPYFIGYIVWTIVGILIYYYTMTKYIYLFEKPIIDDSSKLYKLGSKTISTLKLMVLAFILIIIYIVISNLIPNAQFTLNTSSNTSSRLIIPIMVLTVVIQPVFEGVMIRGIVTDQVTSFKFKHWIKYFIPVGFAVLLHVLAVTTLPIFIFYLVTSLLIQFVRVRFGLITSIHIHMLISLLLFSFFQM